MRPPQSEKREREVCVWGGGGGGGAEGRRNLELIVSQLLNFCFVFHIATVVKLLGFCCCCWVLGFREGEGGAVGSFGWVGDLLLLSSSLLLLLLLLL